MKLVKRYIGVKVFCVIRECFFIYFVILRQSNITCKVQTVRTLFMQTVNDTRKNAILIHGRSLTQITAGLIE